MKALIIAQVKNDQVSNLTYELIGAVQLAGVEIQTALLASRAEELSAEVSSRGGGQVLAVSNPILGSFNDEVHTAVLTALIEKYQPQLVFGGASFYGKALLSRLAAKNGGAMVSDVNGLAIKDNQLVVTRPCYGGNVIARVQSNSSTGPLFVSIRPKVFAESTGGTGEVVVETVDNACFQSGTNVQEVKLESSGSLSLSEADIIVSAGRGIKGPENVGLVEALAAAMRGAFGASRAVVDAGWVPYAMQVGQTGKTVNPKLYVAVGISGAIQHLVGMQSSKTIVAINKDKDAPIFAVANYGIVGDLFEVVPALTAKFSKELS